MEVNWEQIETLFAEVLAQPEPERDRFLMLACAGAPAVRKEIVEMLAAHDRPLGIEPRFLSDAVTSQPDPALGTRIGPYRLLEPLGSGGMGSVWLAEYAEGPLDRKVAVKLVRLSYAPDEARALRRRFASEQRIMARLQHPGIVRLLEAGTAASDPGGEGGYPYFAMDFVAGEPITSYADRQRMRVAERLRLFAQVCDAVHHAHQRLVVHRDLKPSNILVSADDAGRPQVKLLDFGISKLLEDDESAAVPLTETGIRPMTRAYAAPEQVKGESATTSTDVYALGVILFELLAGVRPFEAPTPAQLEQAILTATPSTLRSALARAARTPSGVEEHHLRSDLDAIVQTALRREPSARYGSAEALAADIERYLDGLPVSARTPSAGYRMRTFVRRHRSSVAVVSAGLLVLFAFTIALAVQQRATARERDAAEATAEFLESLFGAADPFSGQRQDTLRIVHLLDRGIERTRVELAGQPLVRARLLHVIGRAYVQLGMHPRAEAPLEEAAVLLRDAQDRPALARSLAELAAVRDAQWRLDEAEELAREALALARSSEDGALLARAELVLATVLTDAGHPSEAEELMREAIERLRGRDSDESAALLAEQTLARAVFDQGRFDEAEALFLHLIERHEEVFGPGDPRLVGVLSPLTFLYLATGQATEAEVVGAEAVALARVVQPGSSTLSQLLATHASVLFRLGRLEEAEELVREALLLPPMRPESHAVPFGTLASILQKRGDLTGAVEAQYRALGLLHTAQRPNPSIVAFSRTKLAGLLRDAGRLEEAEQVLAAAGVEQGMAPTHHGADQRASSSLGGGEHRPTDANGVRPVAAEKPRLDVP